MALVPNKCQSLYSKVKCSPRGIEQNNHKMSLGVFPIGIDPDHIKKTMRTSWVQNRIQELIETFKGRKVLFGVDRLDYIKGKVCCCLCCKEERP